MQRERPCVRKSSGLQHSCWAVNANRTGQASQRPQILAPSPQPSPQPHVLQLHGEQQPRLDYFRWLEAGHRSPEALRYLQQENEYCKLQLRHLSSLRKELEQEVAELVWRQALMMAAQHPSHAPSDNATQHFGNFEYRREPVKTGDVTRFRHLRIPLPVKFPNPEVDPESGGGPPPRCRFPSVVASGKNMLPPPLGGIATAAACYILDEHQRAAACGSRASNYALHSFAPSPTFDLAAFSETTQSVPPGQRLPNRFVLHVVHADTGRTLMEPIVGVSGDVGWVSLGNASGGGGGRVYFTRAAQRELWCLDVKSSQQQHPSQPPQRPEAAAAVVSPRLVFRDPDGQPIQLVQYGNCLYGETLGNTSVPLEVRLLGVCSTGAGADTAASWETEGPTVQSGSDLPTRREGNGDGGDGIIGPERLAAARAHGASGTMAVAAADDDQGAAGRRLEVIAPDAGVPLLPRRPGRQYSVLHLDPWPAIVALAAGDEAHDRGGGGGSGAEQHEEAPGWQRLSDDSLGSNSGSGSGAWDDCDCSGSSDGGSGRGSSCSGSKALLLWLRDLDHSNGCLLVALVLADPLDRCSCDPCLPYVPQPQTKLLELLPHNPHLRIVHAEVRPGGQVLCVREAVDGRGDPAGRYELEELQLDWAAVKQSAMAVAVCRGEKVVDGDGGGSGWRVTAPQLEGGGHGKAPHAEPHPYTRTAVPLALVHRRRTVVVQGPRQHVLRILAWGEGRVTLACSNMAAAPLVSSVDLLPYVVQSCDGANISGPGGTDPDAAASQVAAAMAAAEVRCGEIDPRVMIERLWATSHDGTQVPITLCRMVFGSGETEGGAGWQGNVAREHAADRKSSPSTSSPGTPVPLLLRVYGAYGRDPPLDYQPALQPLLRRGVAVALAHVRGGGLLGPAWYAAGRGAANKANSYLDLLAAAEHLIETRVTTPRLMCLAAESAGGWAAGAALNEMGTRFFRAAVLTVPTLDVLTSLLEDPTYGPYELGDPRADASLYRAVLHWSPYEGLGTVPSVPFPALLMRIGLLDTNVPYWDPAKYMARLRSLVKQDGGVGMSLRLMQVKPGGHEVYDNVADDAAFCAFVLWSLRVWPGSSERVGTRKPGTLMQY